jgi:hypothetical protein
MIRTFLSSCLSLFKSHTQLHLENLFLRKQLEIVTRPSPKLKMRPSDRFFISILTDLYDSWKETLLIVKPETVIRWHRQSFRLFWRWKSRSDAGRPKIPQAQITLIKQMASDNPLWGAPCRGSSYSPRWVKTNPPPAAVLTDSIVRRLPPVKSRGYRWPIGWCSVLFS